MTAGKRTTKTGQEFLMSPHCLESFGIESIIKPNLNLMVFIQELIYLKKGWDINQQELIG